MRVHQVSKKNTSSPLKCKICCNVFSEDHCPRILPCSHLFCGPCIDGLISTQKKQCPSCKKEFKANSAEDFTIIRELLGSEKQLSSVPAVSKTKSTRPKKPFHKVIQDFRENVIEIGIAIFEETEVEVNDRIESNNKVRKGLEEFIQTLEEIKLSSKETGGNIGRDNKLLMDKLDIVKGMVRRMKDSEDKLEAATDFASAAIPMGEAEKGLHDIDETANEIKQLLQENKDNMKQDTLKMKINLKNAMEDIERMTEEEEQQQEETDQEEEEEGQEKERDSVVNIAVADHRSPHGHLRGNAQREIIAVMTFQGIQR
ncbi:E3 ubiquitin-protein ligase TRIM13-like [Macrobrachium rosenbergii]|uniref:E3 ubiquitin-protein ligase TRIM13-like n=1 Tax=Macrobrachium rosenbergii TaxID=79674 RepID=UPI0034D578B3